VSELPIGMWTDKFKEELESLQEVKKIKSFKNYSSTDNVHFEFEKGSADFKINEENLKLNTHINLTNMVLFGENDVIQKFPSIQSIVERFFEKRMELYEIRKKTTLEQFSSELRILQNKRRFIEMVLVQEIVLTSMDESRLQMELKEKRFETQEDSFDYLLRIPIRDFTKNKIISLEEKIKNVEENLSSLKKTKPSRLWLHDLDTFEKEYKKIYM
jgi:DNA topoisomerase-2